MKIVFTGHRTSFANPSDLKAVASLYPAGEWVHGGAKGFDTQVEQLAMEFCIKTTIVRPDFVRYGRNAPFVRNREMVAAADLIVACYDGRTTGGTFYTIQFARQKHVPCQILTPRQDA